MLWKVTQTAVLVSMILTFPGMGIAMMFPSGHIVHTVALAPLVVTVIVGASVTISILIGAIRDVWAGNGNWFL